MPFYSLLVYYQILLCLGSFVWWIIDSLTEDFLLQIFVNWLYIPAMLVPKSWDVQSCSFFFIAMAYCVYCRFFLYYNHHDGFLYIYIESGEYH